MASHELESGQAVEFEIDGQPIVAMILSRLPDGEADGCTHIVEVLPSHLDRRRREERMKIDIDYGTITGRMIGHGLAPFWYKGFHLPPLPEHKEHLCTDRGFLCIFLMSLVFFIWIVVYAVKNGDLRELHKPSDYNGNVCGLDFPDKKYAFWCQRVNEDAVSLRYPICVRECPTSNKTEHFCFDPTTGRNRTIKDYPTVAERFSPYCWPSEGRKAEQVNEAYRRSSEEAGNMFAALPRKALFVVPAAAVTASFFGYIYFKLLEKCVDFIVVVFLLCTTNLSFVLGAYQLLMFWGTGEMHWLASGGLFIVLGMIACRLFLAHEAQSALSMAAGCIEAACECINQEWSLLLEPFVAMVIRGVTLLVCLTVELLLFTTGAPRALDHGEVLRKWVWTEEQQVYIAFVALWTIWLMELSTSVSQFALAWVTERWYFTPYVNDQKLDWERGEVFRGFVHAALKHAGTLAMGSLMIFILRIPRVLLKSIRLFTAIGRESSNPFCFCIANTCCISCDYMYNTIAHINKNAYLGVALTSEKFFRAAVSVDYMLNDKDEVTPVAWLNGMQGIFQFGGLILITAASGAGTLLWIEISNIFGPDIVVRETVVYLAMAVAFPVGLSYMTLFDTVGDTILFCWAVQQRRYTYHQEHRMRNPSAGGGLFASYLPDLDAEVGDLPKVNYAPPALRELVLGRHRKLAFSCCSGPIAEL